MPWSPDYATLVEAKSYVRIPDVNDDAEIALAITAASRAIDRTCNRQFGLVATAEARFYTAVFDRKRGRWLVEIDDLQTSTGLVIKYDTNDDGTYPDTVDKYALQPINGAANGRPWTQIVVHPDSTTKPGPRENAVKVTAQFGWTTVPTPIKQATLLQASRVLARRDSPYGVAGSPEMGSEMRLLAKLDPDVAVAVGPYRRWWGAV